MLGRFWKILVSGCKRRGLVVVKRAEEGKFFNCKLVLNHLICGNKIILKGVKSAWQGLVKKVYLFVIAGR